jgi:hypothetical protein
VAVGRLLACYAQLVTLVPAVETSGCGSGQIVRLLCSSSSACHMKTSNVSAGCDVRICCRKCYLVADNTGRHQFPPGNNFCRFSLGMGSQTRTSE